MSAITAIEQEAIARRTPGERLGDLIARQAGRSWFIGIHAIWFGLWIAINAKLIPGMPAFDPYPYQFLTFVVSLDLS